MENSSGKNPTKIFFDTNFYVALNNPADSLHNQAKQVLQHLLSFDHFDFTSNFVLLETVTLISQRINRKTAIEFREQEVNVVQLVRITKELEEQSWEIFKTIKNKNIGYVDCSILAVIEALQIDLLVSFDRQFLQFQENFSFQVLTRQ